MFKYDRALDVILIIVAITIWIFAITVPPTDSPAHPNHPDYQGSK